MNPTDPNQGGMGGDQPTQTPVIDPNAGQTVPETPVTEAPVSEPNPAPVEPVSENPQPEMPTSDTGNTPVV